MSPRPPSPPPRYEKGHNITDIFVPGGMLSKGLDAYEYRPQQAQMAEAVYKALLNGEQLIVEAGAGTGKTFAYLIPAIYSGKRVVISTGTKNLQEQLFFKDIPLLKEIVPFRFTAAYMKGRENYLCRYRLELFKRQPVFQAFEDASYYNEVLQWATHTKTGDRSELHNVPERLSIWRDICCRRDHCLGAACPMQEDCFLMRMRKAAARAQVICVNHHLFFADLTIKGMGGEVIPPYKRVIFDEAHQLEEVITSHFGLTVSNYRFEELARDIERIFTGRRPQVDFLNSLDELRAKSNQLFSLFQGEERYRLRDIPPEVFTLLADIKRCLSALLGSMKRLPYDEVNPLILRTQQIGQDLEFILSQGDPQYVYWCENQGRGVFLRGSPIDVSRDLKHRLFPHLKAAVFTSATLSAEDGFAYFKQRLGLESAEELQLPSPFDLKGQVVIYLPPHLPDPNDPAFPMKASREIEAILSITRGRALLLFTSHKRMQEVYDLVKDRIPYRLLIQGEQPKHALLEAFKEDISSVLFSTGGFWEGVDVPGEALSCVIIDRLPFDPPTEPLTEARIQQIAAAGGNPFYEYQVPAAIISLKQGLGRLVRKKEDRGVLCILDNRILTRDYGRLFIESLPPAPIFHRLEEIRSVFL